MSSFKGDSYFKPHADDEWESESTDSEPPMDLRRSVWNWEFENQMALLELYTLFKKDGETVFGRAFFQTGTFADFAEFVFRFTTPGATKSKLKSKCP